MSSTTENIEFAVANDVPLALYGPASVSPFVQRLFLELLDSGTTPVEVVTAAPLEPTDFRPFPLVIGGVELHPLPAESIVAVGDDVPAAPFENRAARRASRR